MNKRVGLKAAALGATVALLAACGAGNKDTGSGGAAPNEGVSATTVRVGTISDKGGPTTGIQLPWLHGIEAVAKRVNNSGGIEGRKIELVSEDDKYDVGVGLPAYKKLVSQTPVVAILGLNTSNVQAAVVPLLEKDKIPVISGQTTLKGSVVPQHAHFFGLAPTYADQADVIMAYGKKRTGKTAPRVAIIDNGSASGKELDGLIKARAKDGTEYVGEVILESAATTADAQVQKLIQLKPDFVVFHGSSSGVNLVGKSQQKFGSAIPLIGISPSGGPGAFKGLPPEIGNLYEYVQWVTPAPINEAGTPDMVKAAEAAGYGAEAANPDFVAGYVAGTLLAEALKKAGKNLDRESLTKALESIGSLDTGGLSPNIGYGPKDRSGVQPLRPLKYNYATNAFEAVGSYDDFASALSNEYAK